MQVYKIDIHPKGWGQEDWVWNSDLYCGKLLRFSAGKRCSWHYHKIKDETFSLLYGEAILLTSWKNELEYAETTHLIVGEVVNIPPGMRHQIRAQKESILLELSTTHFESDSYRILKGD
jgi:mannose-6-phosphate isomerase-like protein (cupin superfamily)